MMREDWIEVELGDMLDYIQPSKYIVDSTEYSDNYKTPVLTAGKSFIIGYTNETENIFNDIPVIIFDDFTTATKFVDFNFKVKSSAMKILKPTSDFVNIKYVFYFMQTIRENTDTHKRYWISIFSKVPIPLAPLPEQRAIAAKIEQLFSELDNGIANLKAAKSKLEIYRQAILKQAFEGKLTNPKNQIKDDLPNGRSLKKINSLCEVVRGGSPRPAGDPRYYEGNIPFLKVADLTRNEGIYLNTYTFTIKEAGLKNTRYVEANTLLLSNSGATLGVPKICTFPTTFNDGIAAFLGLDKDDLVYHYYFWMSKTRELRSINQGAAQPNLNTGMIGAFEIPIFSKEEQIQIVQEIENRLSVCDKLNESIDQSLEKAQALRQSILKKAFEGKLLSQDELQNCRQQPDWEPAAKLLERVKNKKSK